MIHASRGEHTAEGGRLRFAPDPDRDGWRGTPGGVFGISTAVDRMTVRPLPDAGASPEAYRAWGDGLGAFLRAVGEVPRGGVGDHGAEVDLSSAGELGEPEFRHIVAGVVAGLGGLEAAERCDVAIRSSASPDALDRLVGDELALRRGVELAISLTDARANQLDPAGFVEAALAVAADAGLGARVTTAAALRTGGFGGITAIGQGSANPSVLLELWYAGREGPGEAPPPDALALAGKGVTFDSGGLSLKPPQAMYGMHTDCAGAATVLGAMSSLASLGVETAVHAALPLVENVPGPASIRPGDVVTARNGTGIEIVDTDFEGRVILADAVALLAEHAPRAILSVATLTYQIVAALGPEIAGLFGRDDAFAETVLDAAATAGEPMWRMPWAERYASRLRSTASGADVRNHPLNDTGRAITAALFIGSFVPPAVPFAHLDFAGPAVANTPDGPAATGYGVRTLVDLIAGMGR